MKHPEIISNSYRTNLWGKRKCYNFSQEYAAPFLEKIHYLKVKHDDVFLVTLPKCGTTWMQELLWLVMNNCDFETAKYVDLEMRSPFMEYGLILNMNIDTSLRPIEDQKSPRLIKSHLPLPFLPQELWHKKPKTIYVYRDPKDAMVSRYYHDRNIGLSMNKTLEEYLNDKINEITYTQSSFLHVSEFYKLRNEPWVFYTSFERMKSNLKQVISDICKFLNKPITAEQMQQMVHHLSFEQMKGNPKTNHYCRIDQERRKLNTPYEHHHFTRKGKVGSYKDEQLSTEFIAKLDKWVDQQLALHHLNLNDLLYLNSEKD